MVRIERLGLMEYRRAWDFQKQVHEEARNGGSERLILVQHPPVITMGRRGELSGVPNLRVGQEMLGDRGMSLVQSDRGGDITYHGPGQVVAYPILRLGPRKLTPGGYVHRLEAWICGCLRRWGIEGAADPSAVGVWVNWRGESRKICAIGVRVSGGVSLHGVALNVSTDLSGFDLIIPCGLPGKSVTSMQQMLEGACPSIAEVEEELVRQFSNYFPVA
jgi:lipoyl(octanoyl) transferase